METIAFTTMWVLFGALHWVVMCVLAGVHPHALRPEMRGYRLRALAMVDDERNAGVWWLLGLLTGPFCLVLPSVIYDVRRWLRDRK